MNRLKKIAKWSKDHPWEAAFWTMTGLALLQTANAMRAIKIINEQNGEIDKANQMFEWIAQAIEKGWDLAIEDGIIDIIPTEDSQPLKAA